MEIHQGFVDSACVRSESGTIDEQESIPDDLGSSNGEFEIRLSIAIYAIIAVIGMAAIFLGASHLAAQIKYQFPFPVKVACPEKPADMPTPHLFGDYQQ